MILPVRSMCLKKPWKLQRHFSNAKEFQVRGWLPAPWCDSDSAYTSLTFCTQQISGQWDNRVPSFALLGLFLWEHFTAHARQGCSCSAWIRCHCVCSLQSAWSLFSRRACLWWDKQRNIRSSADTKNMATVMCCPAGSILCRAPSMRFSSIASASPIWPIWSWILVLKTMADYTSGERDYNVGKVEETSAKTQIHKDKDIQTHPFPCPSPVSMPWRSRHQLAPTNSRALDPPDEIVMGMRTLHWQILVKTLHWQIQGNFQNNDIILEYFTSCFRLWQTLCHGRVIPAHSRHPESNQSSGGWGFSLQ